MAQHDRTAPEIVGLLAQRLQADGCIANGTPLRRGAATGWDARLLSYRWRGLSYAETSEALACIERMGTELAAAIAAGESASPATLDLAERYADAVFCWGSVGPERWAPQDAVAVVAWANSSAPEPSVAFGAGWSKVAALATTHLERCPPLRPHAIADSRVTVSLVRRLDPLLKAHDLRDPADVFPGLAPMPAQGCRQTCAKSGVLLRWPAFQRKWETQRAVSRVVAMLRDRLNAYPAFPSMPLPAGGTGSWTIRGVEAVLFMDGE